MKIQSKNTTTTKTLICPSCGSTTHQWNDVYYDSASVLKKIDNQVIAYCPNTLNFVLPLD